jgi:tetratricopeptide (TPR) repeat protein
MPSGTNPAVEQEIIRVAALLDTDPRAAARAAEAMLEQHPGHPTATLLLGTARRACGDEKASDTFASLATSSPDSAVLQLELGRTLAAQGRKEEALRALIRASELEPDLADAWRELSLLHAADGDTLACDRAYVNFVRLADPERHLNEVATALTTDRFGAAEALLKRRLTQVREDVVALRMLAEVEYQREDYIEGERLLGEVLRIAPGYGAARFELARMYHAQQKAAPILPLVERLLALEPGNLRYRSLQASALSLLGRYDDAMEILAALVQEFPDNELVWLTYGHGLRFAGRSREAVDAYRKAIVLREEFGEAWFSLANLKTFRFSTADIEQMRRQLGREDLQHGDRLQFEFALGKALEDERNFADSFEHYSRGNALRRQQVPFDLAANTRLIQRTISLFTREFIEARRGAGSPAGDPIFILGMPRAGSTLIEQILASHSQVEGTRELPDIPGFALELGLRDAAAQPSTYPQPIARLTRKQLHDLGERYLAQTRPGRHSNAAHFIDKMPSNFFHVGLIHLILPRARIIDARRSPLACCFANFKQHFQSGVWFSYDLEDIGHYYRDYVRLMAHFDSVLPGRVHRVYYENIVTNLEVEVRRLLEYCGLPFEPQCLRFHETRRIVHTASSEQVRQPIYTDGIDQWRHFEPWLGKLKAVLGDLIDDYPHAKS